MPHHDVATWAILAVVAGLSFRQAARAFIVISLAVSVAVLAAIYGCWSVADVAAAITVVAAGIEVILLRKCGERMPRLTRLLRLAGALSAAGSGAFVLGSGSGPQGLGSHLARAGAGFGLASVWCVVLVSRYSGRKAEAMIFAWPRRISVSWALLGFDVAATAMAVSLVAAGGVEARGLQVRLAVVALALVASGFASLLVRGLLIALRPGSARQYGFAWIGLGLVLVGTTVARYTGVEGFRGADAWGWTGVGAGLATCLWLILLSVLDSNVRAIPRPCQVL